MTELVMGEGLKVWGERQTFHSFIHSLLSIRFAYPDTAIVVQQKQIPDVSYYQKLIDWDKFRSQTDSVIIRAGQNLWIDEYFFTNWQSAKAQKMMRGCYWFYDGRVDPGKQAALLVSMLQGDLPEMEIWLDWETNYSGAFEGLKNVVAMMQRIETLLPDARVGLYTGYYFFVGNSNPITNAGQYSYLKTHPLWLAWYTNDASVVKVPSPWSSLAWWQFGTPALGTQYGVGALEIDMSFFNGTTEEFYTTYGGIVPPIGGNMDYVKGTTTAADSAGGLKVRTSTVTADDTNVIGHLPYNTPVEGYLNNGWIQGTFKGLAGYISAAWVAYTITTPPTVTSKVVTVNVSIDGFNPLTLSGTLTPK